MFKREILDITGEDYCPVVEAVKTNTETASSNVVKADPKTTDRRGEIFVLAANIYYRARRNTRARAAGIL